MTLPLVAVALALVTAALLLEEWSWRRPLAQATPQAPGPGRSLPRHPPGPGPFPTNRNATGGNA